MRGIAAAVVVFAVMVPGSVAWGTLISEGAGDLSNNGLAPSGPFVLTLGSNPVTGSYGAQGGVPDRDYFSFVVPVGYRLDQVLVGAGFTAGGSVSFIGIEVGPQVTVDPTSGSTGNLLGFALVGAGDIGTDILNQLGGPLGEGTYSVWIQETRQGVFPYEYRFQVAVIPEPGVAMVAVAVGGGLLGRRRR